MTRHLALLAAFVLLVACGGTYDPDDPNPDNGDPGCAAHAECAHDELCHASECQGALDRRYRITIVDAEVGTTMPNGETWDMGGGAPDLAVLFGFDEQSPYVTDVVDDTFSATWNQYAEEVVPSGGAFFLIVADEDVSEHDAAAGWQWEGTDALMALVRTDGVVQEVTDSTGTVKARFKFEPLF